MTTYRELLSQVEGARSTRSTPRAACAVARDGDPSVWTSASSTSGTKGTFPARSTSRAAASSRAIENAVPDHDSRIVVYCAGGARSAFAAKTLEELGYENVVSLDRRLHGLEAQRLPDRAAAARSTREQRRRY